MQKSSFFLLVTVFALPSRATVLKKHARLVLKSSGVGPTDDGRIKPDLVAVGERNSSLGFGSSLFAANKVSSTSYYDGTNADSSGAVNLAGTSFAAPSVSGGLMLAEQRRKQLLPAAGRLLASTWKAAAIGTVNDIESLGPDYRRGWGVFDAEALITLIEMDTALGRGSLIKEFSVDENAPKTFFLSLPANVQGELTLAWTDPASLGAAAGAFLDDSTALLINDLNLEVQDVASLDDYLPWILTPDFTGESAAVRGAAATPGIDNRNNVEKVTVEASSIARRLKVTISPVGTLQGSTQEVSLVLEGVVPEAPKITESAFTLNPSNMNEFAITFEAEPGAFCTLQNSTSLEVGSWSDVSTVKADDTTTTILTQKDPTQDKLFWRIRRGQ